MPRGPASSSTDRGVEEVRQTGDSAASRLRVPTALLSVPYEQAIAQAKSEHRVLAVALESGENNRDAATFLSQTLLSPELDQLFERHNILLWAGDVSAGKEAAQVSRILHVTHYPFMAFIASQSRPTALIHNTSSRRIRLAVLSRHQGARAVGLPLLTAQVEQVLLPRVGPFLQSLRDEKQAQLAERQWRSEQEEAYALAAQRDADRIAAKRAEAQRIELAQKEQEAKQQAKVQLKARYLAWRRWAIQAAERGAGEDQLLDGILVPGTDKPAPGVKTEFVIRLPLGEKTTVYLPPDAKAEALFAAIELASPSFDGDTGKLAMNDGAHEGASSEQAGGFAESELASFRPEYNFSLVTDYPRRIVRPTAEVLRQTLLVSGLMGQSTRPPRRVALILEGQVGWESEESTSEEEEEEEDK